MSNQDKQPVSVAPNTTKQPKTEPSWAIPKWIAKKAVKDNLSFKAVAVYKWIYDHNNHAKYLDNNPNALFTKGSLDALYAAIRRDIDVSVRDICMELRGKGWIEPIKNAPLFNGRRQSGFICRLSKDDRQLAKAIQQEIMLPDEEAVIEVESSLPDTGEYVQFGIRYYDTPDGTQHQVPTSAPPRPTKTAVWSSDPEGWYEPEDLPTHDLEY